MQRAKAQYERDRDAVRKAKPKTEAEVVAVLGRKPDSVLESGAGTFLHWYYETKPEGRDVLAVTVKDGKIILMDL